MKSKIIWLFFGLQLLAYAGLALEDRIFGTLTHGQLPQTLAWVALAFVAYGITIWRVERDGGISMPLIWLGAILFRLLLLLTEPTLSSDVYRYLWDGYVANNGVSPYAFPIESPQLDYLTHPVRDLANHTWMASPYLPAAQWLFGRVTAWLPITAQAMQVTMVAVDLLNGLLIIALLRIAKLPTHRALIYLWNPLVVVEIAQGAHIDGWMIFLTLLAIWLWVQAALPKRPTLKWIFEAMSPIMLAFATLTKILPAFLMVIFFWRWRWWRIFLFGGVVVGFLIFAGTRAGWGLTGPLDGHGLFGALRIYGDRWNFNSGIFHWIEETLGPDGWFGWELVVANQWAKRIVGLALLGVLGGVWIRARKVTEPRAQLRLMAIPFMAYVLLAATMHPWYLLLLLAFVPFLAPAADERVIGWLWVLPWLYLSAALFLSYLTYLDPLDLREYEWIRRTEWVPTLVLLVVAGVGWSYKRV